jgi:hypothetical protein
MAERAPRVGWREWLALPDLGILHIKAKIDTGARTSALHAFYVHPYRRKGVLRVRFMVHPLQKRKDIVISCDAEVIDRRWVSDSGGHRERRYCIGTRVELGGFTWPIEMTLTDRDTMLFRLLLGRTALARRFVIDPARSYLCGAPPSTHNVG